jgi:hypothetical protein
MDEPEDADLVKDNVLEIDSQVKEHNRDYTGGDRIDTKVIEGSPAALLRQDCQAYSRQWEDKTTNEGVKKGDGEVIEPADGFRCTKSPPGSKHLPCSHKQEYAEKGG